MDYKLLIILTFIITGIWDIILRFMTLNYEKLPTYFQMDFVENLIPYFKHHTLLSAALIAGFIGATTQIIILSIMSFPENIFNISYIIKFLILTFTISALYGFMMKGSKLFPYLEKYYYDKLGVARSMYTDGVSGLIVQTTLLIIIYFVITK
jgi:type III secretory pathway component EscT